MKSIKQNKESIEEILKEYQQALKSEQGRSERLVNHVQILEQAYHRLKGESNYWESQFAELAWLANQAVRDVPNRLKRAEAEMLPFNTPVKVYEFVEFCKTLTEELMEKAKGAAASKKRKRDEELKAICL